jgi:hypothetical protein
MNDNEKMLIFNNADNDMAMLPLSRLKDINGSTGSIVITFDAEADVDSITLHTGADEFEACKELVRAFNQGPHSDGAIVIADDVAGVYCSSTITGLSIN